jgi:HEAT repeat protein
MKRLLVMALGCLLLGLIQAGPVPAQSRKAQELIQDLKDKNPKVRAAAAQDIARLAQVRLADAKAALPSLQAAARDPDPEVRSAVMEALASIEADRKGAITIYVDTLKREKSPVVQRAAATALFQMQPPPKEARDKLVEIYKAAVAAQREDIDSVTMRGVLVGLIIQTDRDPKKTVAFYIDVIKREKNLSNRVTAVQGLGQIGPPAKAAMPTLKELQKTAKALKDKDLGLGKAIDEALQRIGTEVKK